MSITVPPLRVIKTDKEAIADVAEMDETSLYGLDSETANPNSPYREWDAPAGCKRQIIIWSYYDHSRKLRVVVHGNLTHHYAKWLANPKARKVGSNLQFDSEVFRENGFPVAEKSWVGDTVTESFYTDENRLSHGLKENMKEVTGYAMSQFKQLFGYAPLKKDGTPAKNKWEVEDLWTVWANKNPLISTTREQLYEYSGEDPWASVMVHLKHKKQMIEEGTWEWYRKWELPFTFVLLRMEKRGIRLDLRMMEAIGKEVEAQQARIECVFRSEIGKPLFNMASNDQKKKLLLHELGWPIVKLGNETKSGDKNPSLDAEAMQIYKEEHGFELAEWLLDHAGVTTLKNTFIDGLMMKVRAQGDGICRTRFNQTRAKTGRLSSGDRNADPPLPNLQNIPARKEKDPYGIRSAFTARKGKVLIVKDYSGIELTGIAEVSGDATLVALLQRGENAHAKTAAALFSLPYPEVKVDPITKKVTKDYKAWLEKFKAEHDKEYAVGKQTNFSLNYRMSVQTYAKRMKITEEEAAERMDLYFNTYGGIAVYMDSVVKQARKDGYVTTLAGTRRRLPEIFSQSRKHREHAERAAINAPIQGLAARVIQVSMCELDAAYQRGEIKSQLLLQVHDELVFECDEKDAKEDEAKINKIMIEAPMRVLNLQVPIGVGGSIASNWREAK
jgi:DNA polymerase-1